MKYILKIKADGSLEFLGFPPPRLPLPYYKRYRFSEIVPVRPKLRITFRLLRLVFGEEGRVAEWTRSWRCIWECKILMGPARGLRLSSIYRDQLVRWEQDVWKTDTTPGNATRLN